MFLKAVFPSRLIVTIVTTIFDSIMDRFYMFFKAAFRSCLIVTLFTNIFDSIMDRFHMSFKAAFLSRLIVIIFTTICDSISYFSSLFTNSFHLTKVRELCTRTIPHGDYLILSIGLTDEGGSGRYYLLAIKIRESSPLSHFCFSTLVIG